MPFTTSAIKTLSDVRHGQKILMIYTGGTIGMQLDEQGAYAPVRFEELIKHINPFKHNNFGIEFASFDEPIDSSNISPKHWNRMGQFIYDQYELYDGFVVLHGTDTMSFTGSALSYMFTDLNKPVIFTGSQLPLGETRSDARENLITALQIASAHMDNIPIVNEVALYFGNSLLRANRSKKVESIQFNAFESENYPVLAEAGVIIDYNFAFLKPYDFRGRLRFNRIRENCNVGVLKLFPGISKRFVMSVLGVKGLEGIVLETYGAGNILNTDWFLTCLKEVCKKGIFILNVSQCPGGKVMQGRYKSSSLLEEIGVISGSDITLEAAITKLMYLLSVEKEAEVIKKRLSLPIRGEMA